MKLNLEEFYRIDTDEKLAYSNNQIFEGSIVHSD
jgi:hypothetical protein